MGRTRAVIGLSVVVVVAVALIIALAGAGDTSTRRASGPFAWLRPGSPPGRWHVVRIPNGAALAYPPGWTAIKSDPGSASVAVRGAGGEIEGYLNVTPRQGAESLANWSRFRIQKNRSEGERDEHLLAAANDLHFRSARGSCVIDSYRTSLTTYEEIACLLSGAHSSSVVVAAAPTRLWRSRSAVLERAVSSFAA